MFGRFSERQVFVCHELTKHVYQTRALSTSGSSSYLGPWIATRCIGQEIRGGVVERDREVFAGTINPKVDVRIDWNHSCGEISNSRIEDRVHWRSVTNEIGLDMHSR